MKRASTGLLLHPLFLASLFLLLFNDAYLKWQHPSWLSGKLSDVAGLIAFALFCTALLPQLKKWIFLLTALLFSWWKSPWSSVFIARWNELEWFGISRVVDYSDLLALFFLPIAFYLTSFPVKPPALRRPASALLKLSLGALAVFAFTATSMVRRPPIPEGDVWIGEDYKVKLTQAEVLDKLTALGFDYQLDSVISDSPPTDTITINNDTQRAAADSTFLVERNNYTNPYYRINAFRLNDEDTAATVRFYLYPLTGEKTAIRLINVSLQGDFNVQDWQEMKRYHKEYREAIEEGLIEKIKEKEEG